jgi:hypothetical protein
VCDLLVSARATRRYVVCRVGMFLTDVTFLARQAYWTLADGSVCAVPVVTSYSFKQERAFTVRARARRAVSRGPEPHEDDAIRSLHLRLLARACPSGLGLRRLRQLRAGGAICGTNIRNPTRPRKNAAVKTKSTCETTTRYFSNNSTLVYKLRVRRALCGSR